jgi:hypothetical protein
MPSARGRTPERNVVFKLQLANMMDEGEHVYPVCMISPAGPLKYILELILSVQELFIPIRYTEGHALFHFIEGMRTKFLKHVQELYLSLAFPFARLNLNIDITKQAARETVQNRIADVLTSYTMIDQTKKCFHVRVGFGWMFPVAEEEKTFAVGVKMYPMAPREKIAFTSTSSNSTSKLIPEVSLPQFSCPANVNTHVKKS